MEKRYNWKTLVNVFIDLYLLIFSIDHHLVLKSMFQSNFDQCLVNIDFKKVFYFRLSIDWWSIFDQYYRR